MSGTDLLPLLLAFGAVLLAAHLLGAVAERLRQPRMAGEIVAGLLLGATVLGHLAPSVHNAVFPATGAVGSALSAVQNIGMLVLMLLAGTEVRKVMRAAHRRLVTAVIITGLVVPLAGGVLVVQGLDLTAFLGTAGNAPALVLVVASAIAVTSIPVISRIMMDLGIMRTGFASVVLATAITEDVVLYVVIAIALGLVQAEQADSTGLPHLLGLGSTGVIAVYYVVTTLAFFAVFTALVTRLARSARVQAWCARQGPVGRTSLCVILTLVCAAAAAALGIQPMFGAFVAGILISRLESTTGTAIVPEFRSFAFSFFLPIYFCGVGMRLDLVDQFSLWLTVSLVAIACVLKLGSVYVGSRLSGEKHSPALSLAFAVNARGGPGIVLAGLALDFGIVNQILYTTLIILAVVTSLMAGARLRHARDRDGLRLRGEEIVATAGSAAEPASGAR